ncbi:sporulation protein YlmC with PRC-barrel domain [Natronocella acetinitrilica]|uniref:Sporulation protein YlmC with PRC-barrel domain n=1 Tax=Natronocella acetinitrilica TaxID=414046 RepID=A0AAE3GAX2_9GAMM|nr:sporulation protein YlmC with PRC-barrel domain [Natronocella acetinitrilica]
MHRGFVAVCLFMICVLGQKAIADETGNAPPLWSAQDILGAVVHDADGERLGTVNDAIFDRLDLHAVVLSVGGVFGIGSSRLILEYDRLTAEWHDFGPSFQSDLGREEINQLATYERDSVRPHNRLNWLLSEPIWNARGEWIGFIDDLLIADRRMVAVIIPVGGFLGIGTHKVAVRYDDLDDDGESFLLDTTRDELLQAEPVDYARMKDGERPRFLDGSLIPIGPRNSSGGHGLRAGALPVGLTPRYPRR